MAKSRFLVLGFAAAYGAERVVTTLAEQQTDDLIHGIHIIRVGPKSLSGSRDVTVEAPEHELAEARPAALIAGIMDAEPWRVRHFDQKWHVAEWALPEWQTPEYNLVDSLTELSNLGSAVLIRFDTTPDTAELVSDLSTIWRVAGLAEPSVITSLVLDQPPTATVDSISNELTSITGRNYDLQVAEGGDLQIIATAPELAAINVTEHDQPAPGNVQRFIQGRYHKRVQVNQSFLIAVQIGVSRPEDGTAVAVDLPAAGTRVHAMLKGSKGLAVESEQDLELVVPPGRDTGWHAWQVRAKSEGSHQAVVCFHHYGEVLAALVFDVEAGQTHGPVLDSDPQAISLAPLTTTQGLLVVSSPKVGTLRFVALDGREAGVAVVAQKSFDPTTLNGFRTRQTEILDSIARANYVGRSAAEDAAKVRALGTELLDSLPEEIREFLLSGLPKWQSLKIETDDESLAWELLSERQLGPESYLANRVPFLRWRTGIGRPTQALAFAQPLLVQGKELQGDRGDAASFNAQIKALQRRLGANDDAVITDTGTLNTRINQGNFDLLHYAGHMSIEDGDPSLHIGNSIYSVARIKTLPSDALTHRPLVFLNACATNVETPQLTGPAGWVKEFLSAGAGSFIGTNWRVRATTAESFAEHFYDALTQGHNLATASRQAREHTLTEADWASLAYTVYGHPDACLGTPQPTQEPT